MADLFSLTAPLLIRYPDNTKHVMVHCFPHPDGLVYFRIFWDRLPEGEGICLARGEVRGEGPWKAGDAVITVLGCHGVNPEQASDYADWQLYLEQQGAAYPSLAQLRDRVHDLMRAGNGDAGFYTVPAPGGS